jgi:hypothetical protein
VRHDDLSYLREAGAVIRRILVVSGLVAVLALGVLAEAAFAYIRVYYLGSASQPVSFTGGVYASTCCNAFRLFNEMDTPGSSNPVQIVSLYYNSTKIGEAYGTYYYIVYRNGENVKAACNLSAGGNVVRAVCDTAT